MNPEDNIPSQLRESTKSEAIAASHERDASRTICRFCGRRQADHIDCDSFNSLADCSGGERPDLCWAVAVDDICKAYQDLHSAIEILRADGVSHAEISASVERALLPNNAPSSHQPIKDTP
jgi:hypothetical protein